MEQAVKASKYISNGAFIICARTDARGVFGLEETIKRSKVYIDAGADMIFPEGLTSEQEFDVVAKELRKHKRDVLLLANMTEFGKTPHISHKQFESMGYNCVIYPVSTLRIAIKAIGHFLDDLEKTGTTHQHLPNMQTRENLYKALDYNPGTDWNYPNPTRKDK